jgi:hypothetical protein
VAGPPGLAERIETRRKLRIQPVAVAYQSGVSLWLVYRIEGRQRAVKPAHCEAYMRAVDDLASAAQAALAELDRLAAAGGARAMTLAELRSATSGGQA